MDTEKEKVVEQPDYKALIADGIAAALKAQEDAQAAKAAKDAELKAVADAAYKQALEDVKANKAPLYHTTAPVDDDNDGVGAFKHWMQTGQQNQGLIVPDSSFDKIPSGKAAWNVTTGASGAFTYFSNLLFLPYGIPFTGSRSVREVCNNCVNTARFQRGQYF